MELDLLSLKTTRTLGTSLLLSAVCCASPHAGSDRGASPKTAHAERAPAAAETTETRTFVDAAPLSPVASAPPAPDRNSNSTDVTVPELPAGTTVLHIGDSFAGALGIALNEQFKRHGVRGVLRYKTASFIPTWAFQENVPLMMLRYQPDLVLISLGANELEIIDPPSRAPVIRRLVQALGGRPCVWIAPPLWAGETGLLKVIREHAAPCRYMDSTALVPNLPRAKDQIHPSMDAREPWAKVVVEWLARERCVDCGRPWELKPEPAAGASIARAR